MLDIFPSVPTLGGTFTTGLVIYVALLAVIFTVLVLFSTRRRGSEGERRKLVTNVGRLLLLVTLASAVTAFTPTDSLSRPGAFFFLQGAVAGLLALYVGLGGKRRSVLLIVLLISSFTITTSVSVRNGFYPQSDYRNEPLYTSGRITAYQADAVAENLYYYIPISPLTTVPLGMAIGLGVGLEALFSFVLLLVTMLGLWAFAERLGLTKASPALFLVVSTPQLSFVLGRVLSLPYAVMVVMLLGLLTARALARQTLALMVVVSAVMVFSHPLGSIALIAGLGVFYVLVTVVKRKYSPLSLSVRPVLRLLLVMTTGYWFTTFVYTFIVSKAVSIYDSTTQFVVMLSGGQSQLLTGSSIPTGLAPGYSQPAFGQFAYAWAAPIALGVALLLTWSLGRLSRGSNGWMDADGMLSGRGFSVIIGIACSLAATVLLGSSFAAYSLGAESGQYSIPAAYFLLVVASLVMVDRLLSSKRLATLAITALILASVVAVGVYSPDWSPLEHTDFQVAATIYPQGNYFQISDLQPVLLPANYTIYSDHNIILVSGQYKDVSRILQEVFAGQKNLTDYSDSLFMLIAQRFGEPLLAAQLSGNDVVYHSNGFIAVLTR